MAAAQGGAEVPVRCLVVDDEEPFLRMIVRAMGGVPGVDVTTADRGDRAVELLDGEHEFDLVLSDVQMPGRTGHEVLRHVRSKSKDVPVIMMSAVAGVDDIMELQREGATLFLRKPFSVAEFQLLMNHATHLARQLRTVRDLHALTTPGAGQIPGLVGRSPVFLRALVNLAALARTDAPVLILGETGTGKELVARAIHGMSPRRAHRMVAVNCSALTDTLVDSELFGHEKGAFTGALKDNPGLFRSAEGGTLFLDEIGDLSPAGQAKLLRVLQEKEVRPVGSTRSVKVNVRVVAATHRDLHAAVKAGTFRQDLLYRLVVGQVTLPPLRARPDDVLLLAHTFLERCRVEFGTQARGFSPEAVTAMMTHGWPGNVRELEAYVTRAAAVAQGAAITPEDLGLDAPPGSAGDGAPEAGREDGPLPPFSDAKQQAVDAFERAYLCRLLGSSPQVGVAAQRAGIDRKSLYRLIRKHGLGTLRDDAGGAEDVEEAGD